jgi:hypothetical protein
MDEVDDLRHELEGARRAIAIRKANQQWHRDNKERLDARILLLESALHQAQNLVEFLHGCLTDPKYQYAFPDQTAYDLAEWGKLAPRPDFLCVHSRHDPECTSCQEHVNRMTAMAKANSVLAQPLPDETLDPNHYDYYSS